MEQITSGRSPHFGVVMVFMLRRVRNYRFIIIVIIIIIKGHGKVKILHYTLCPQNRKNVHLFIFWITLLKINQF